MKTKLPVASALLVLTLSGCAPITKSQTTRARFDTFRVTVTEQVNRNPPGATLVVGGVNGTPNGPVTVFVEHDNPRDGDKPIKLEYKGTIGREGTFTMRIPQSCEYRWVEWGHVWATDDATGRVSARRGVETKVWDCRQR